MASTGMPLLAVAVATGTTEIKRMSQGKAPTMKPVIGGFALGAMLLILIGINEDLGVAFSVLVIIASFLVNGTVLIDALNNATSNLKGN